MLILSFAELNVRIAEYNGMKSKDASAAIINIAADAVTLAKYGHPETCIEMLYDWKNTVVNFVLQRVEIRAMRYDIYMRIVS